MAIVAQILEAIENIAPARWALSFDKVGLQVGRHGADVERAIVSLDWSDGLLAAAIEQEAQLIVCHHPLIWDPMTAIDESTRTGRFAMKLIENGVAFVACHTNWDAAPGGVNDALAMTLGLSDVSEFGDRAKHESFKLVTYCPHDAVDGIIDALEAVGAGRIGDYNRCAFTSEGTGTFRGNNYSQPTVGESGKRENVGEVRIEMIVPANVSSVAIDALYRSHPYEEPAYDLLVRKSEGEMPLGRIGSLVKPLNREDFRFMVEGALGTAGLCWGPLGVKIRRVAVCGGAADSMWRDALAAGADAFITGEVKQSVAVEASEAELTIVAAGHYATEQPGMSALVQRLQAAVSAVSWSLYEPEPSTGGRPA